MSELVQSRAEFQQLAEIRLEEARLLLDAGQWSGAYYLAGYAVELGLKACIIKRLMSRDAFPDKKFSDRCYTHEIGALVDLAGLKVACDIANASDPVLLKNWAEVGEWSEVTRYHRVEQTEAEELYRAIADDAHGVLTWIRSQW